MNYYRHVASSIAFQQRVTRRSNTFAQSTTRLHRYQWERVTTKRASNLPFGGDEWKYRPWVFLRRSRTGPGGAIFPAGCGITVATATFGTTINGCDASCSSGGTYPGGGPSTKKYDRLSYPSQTTDNNGLLWNRDQTKKDIYYQIEPVPVWAFT